MPADRVRVFISSSMAELSTERRAVHSILAKDRIFEPFAWEADAGARSSSARDAWRAELAEAHICIAILWHKLGEWTRDEIATAMASDLSLLVYVKLDPDGSVDPDVEEFLHDLEDPATGEFVSGRFDNVERLRKLVTRDLARVLADTMSTHRGRGIASRREVTGSGRSLAPAPADRGWEATEAPRPAAPGRRPVDELGRLPRHRGRFVNRTDEIARVRRVLEGDDRIAVVAGLGGVGKKALCSHLTYLPGLDEHFPDGAGVRPEQADCDDAEDLVQAIWEEFYAPEQLGQVEPRQRLRQLRSLRSLLFLLDVDLDGEQIDQLLDAVPNSTFCVTARGNRRLPGKQVRLEPLADADHLLELFEARYQAEVPAPARDHVVTLCRNVGATPARVLLLADLAWTEAEDRGGPPDATHPLVAWAAGLAALDADALVTRLVSPDTAQPASIVAAVGVPVPHAVLAAVTSTEHVDGGVADLVLQPGSPRYRVNPAAVALHDDDSDATASPVDDALLAPVFDASLTWADQATPEVLFDDRAFVLRMLEWGGANRRWSDVVRLARRVEPAVARGGRWGAWESVLQHALTASRALRDEHTEAWALHQLGARALVRDDLEGARTYLHRALETRERLGDTDAAAVTRRTLRAVPLALAGLTALVAAVLLLVAWGGSIVFADRALETTRTLPPVDISPEIVPTGRRTEVTIVNVVAVPLLITFDDRSLVVDSHDCDRPLAPRDACHVTVDSNVPAQLGLDIREAGRPGLISAPGDTKVQIVKVSSAP